jgi:flagellar protein FliO/FliZ
MPGSGVEAGASYGDLLVTSMLVLGAVCIAAFMAVRFFGRFAGGRTRGAHLMEVIARVPLEPRRSLYVVEVAGKTLLVGTSEMGLSVLSELDAAEVKTRAVPPQSFADLVRGAWQKRKRLPDAAAETRGDAGSKQVTAETRGDAGSKDVAAEAQDRAHLGSDSSAKDVSAESSSVQRTADRMDAST